MHLKICPNPKCGKISEVGVAVCEFCGQDFPKVEADAASPAPAASPLPGNATGPATKEKPRTSAWPLIMVAVAAGGLPLLWANRAHLPTPKPWQGGTSETQKVEPVLAPVVKIQPPVAPTPTPAAAPAQAPGDAAASSSAAPAAGNADQANPADGGTKEPATAPQAGDSPKEPAKKVAKTPPPKKKETRPCTEATAALGLCDPKRSGQ